MPDPIIIAPHAGGGGDLAALSTILDEMHVRGRTALISSRYGLPRNDELRELFWDRHPHFKGWSDEEPNAGLRGRVAEWGRIIRTETHNPIAAVEKMHGCSSTFSVPQIHYQPKKCADLANTILAEPTSSTQQIPAHLFHEFADHVTRDFGRQRSDVVVLKPKIVGEHGRDTLAGNPIYSVANIYEWIDAIYSCKVLLCTEAFAQSVAAAVRQNRPTYSLHSDKAYAEKLFIYPGVTYVPDGRIAPLYHSGIYPIV